jgi:glutamine amidotransferase
MKNVTIIDYGMSNLLSIARAIEHVGAEVIITDNPNVICKADYLILPGVGAFYDGMHELNKRFIPSAISQYLATGKPFLGICLGMQMMLDEGEEIQLTKGLGIIPGYVKPLPLIQKDESKNTIPHVCWSKVKYRHLCKGTPFENIEDNSYFYFVHSYFAAPTINANSFASTSFGDIEFSSVVNKDNAWGMQFHPEKSGEIGLSVLSKFITL